MSHTAETLQYRGYTICIEQDENPENPRKDRDWLGTMTCWHRRYALGDKHSFDNPEAWLRHLAAETGTIVNTDSASIETVRKIVDAHYLMLPLFLYDHSGITMSTGPFSCSWDSGQVGYIWVSHKKIREEYGVKRINQKYLGKPAVAAAKGLLEAEVKVYDHYLTGDVYGWVVKDRNGEHVDSCWGYYGSKPGRLETDESACSDWNYMLECARDSVDGTIRHAAKKHAAQVKQWIRNKVALLYRTPFGEGAHA